MQFIMSKFCIKLFCRSYLCKCMSGSFILVHDIAAGVTLTRTIQTPGLGSDVGPEVKN